MTTAAALVRVRPSWSRLEGDDIHDPVAVSDAIRRAIEPWRGTPWAPGILAPGLGVDCVRFVGRVYDALDGVNRAEDVDRLPQDLALRDRGEAIRAMRAFLRLYAPVVRVDVTRKGRVQPGDLLVVSTEPGAGPGHAIIVGPDTNTLWESAGGHRRGRVRMGGWSLARGVRIFRAYRRADRSNWHG